MNSNNIPFIPICYFGKNMSNNFEIIDIFYKIQNTIDSLEQTVNFISDLTNINQYSFESMDINYKLFNIKQESIQNKYIRNYFIDTFFKMKECTMFDECIMLDDFSIEDLIKEHLKYNLFGTKNIDSPLFIYIFLEYYKDEKTKKTIENLLVEYNTVRDSLFNSYSNYYGILSIEQVFDFEKIKKDKKIKENFTKKKLKLKKISIKERRKDNINNYEVIPLLENNNRNSNNINGKNNSGKSEKEKIKKGMEELSKNTEIYDTFINYSYHKYNLNSIFKTIIKYFENLFNLQYKKSPLQIFKNLMYIDFYMTKFIFYYVNKKKFVMISQIDKQVKEYSTKIFSIFNKYINQFIDWYDIIKKLEKKENTFI